MAKHVIVVLNELPKGQLKRVKETLMCTINSRNNSVTLNAVYDRMVARMGNEERALLEEEGLWQEMGREVHCAAEGCTAHCHIDGAFDLGWRSAPLADVSSNDKGKVGFAYLCPRHAMQLVCPESYFSDNEYRKGKATKLGITSSVEFETVNPDMRFHLQMMHYGWLPTRDCTVDVEYKSPIWRNRHGVRAWETMEELIASGHAAVDESCGTHVHMGHWGINGVIMAHIRQYCRELFEPLNNIVADTTEQCEALFGRPLNGGWANPIDFSNPTAHTNWVNLQHEYTIEYRVCKFRNATQYLAAMKFCQLATLQVVNQFVLNIGGHYADGTPKEQGCAEKCGRSLERLYRRTVGLPTKDEE